MKRLTFITLFAVVISIMAARYSDNFPLGTYSYICDDPWNLSNLSALSSGMHDLGYNTNLIQTFNPNFNLDGIYASLNDNSLDAILMDKAWSSTTGSARYATTALTTGCYYKFEAEFEDESYVKTGDNTDSQYWYGARDETVGGSLPREGGAYPITGANYDYVWRCEHIEEESPPGGVPGIPGFPGKYCVYTDLRYRWLTTEDYNIRVGKEFRLRNYTVDNPAEDSLYIRFRFRFMIPAGDTTPGNTVLLSFAPVGYEYSIDGHSSVPTPILHTNGIQSSEETYLTLSDYDNMFEDQEERNVFKDIEIKISYQDLINNNLLITSPNNSACKILVNLNPRLYYHNHFTLDLDYIEIEDRMHRELRLNSPEHIAGIEQRITEMRPSGYEDLVTNIYTADEPFQPQFDSYKRVQDILVSQSDISPMTAVYDLNYREFPMDASNAKYYDHIDLFNKMTEPKIIMPDIYPIRADAIYQDWNSEGNVDNSLQWMLDNKLIAGYLSAKNPESGDADKLFYPVVQAFGHWNRNSWTSWILPPPAMQKMLQYLPLCFDADGIFSYRLYGLQKTNGSEIVGDYAAYNALVSVSNLDNNPPLQNYGLPVIFNPTYNAIQEANQKISIYSELLKTSNIEWLGSNTVIVNSAYPNVDISALHLSGINISEPIAGECYHGYVQCGYYKDAYDFPSFMIVNRRANYFTSNDPAIVAPRQVPVSSYDQHFPPFGSQTVEFIPAPSAHTLFGTHIALYDPFDNALYQSEGLHPLVDIGPGDGKLLQMCASLPDTVTCNADLKSIAYLSGSITIDDSTEVNIHAGTNTTIFPHSTILVKGNSILNLAGIVTIKDTVNIIVEEGSSINFNGAICIWGVGSTLTIDGSEMTAYASILMSKNESQRWQGIQASNTSTVSLDDTEINGAASNTVYNSNVYLTNCSFNIPAYSTGLIIDNWTASYDVRISATVDGKGFFGKGMPAYGLAYGNQCNSTFIAKTCFKDLTVGLENLCNLAVRDTIINCGFMDNERGIRIASNQFSPYIYTCNFVDNEIGIDLDLGASPEISNCTFDNCEIGIKTEMSSASSGGIYDCIFTSSALHRSRFGIVSRGSNLRVADNKFYTNYGILNHSGSILNMGNSANNLFNATKANFQFQDTATYNAYVQLYLGHNDFYHEFQGLLNPTCDFHFDVNWFQHPMLSNAINVSYNWFEDSIVEIVCPPGGIPTKYVRYTELDLSPNVFIEVYERMALALVSEKQGDYVVANDTYRAILDEDLDAESTIMLDALDAYYRTSALVGDAPSETQAYLIAKTNQYAADNPLLTKYAEDYTLKSYLNTKDYQAAIDMIQVRLTNPESEIDSLLAVMDLEIVLQLAAMDQSKRPITTKYTQYIYPNRKIYNARHAEHWDKLNQLYNTEEDLVPIPNSSVISSNYPNPFNPITTIAFSIPEDSRVKLTIFNIKGQKIKDLGSENMLRGHHKFVWDGRDDGNRKVSSGIYFVKLEAPGNSYTHKMMLMK